jgi:hypothetical protein
VKEFLRRRPEPAPATDPPARPRTTVRVAQFSRMPCPSGKYHACTDPYHPIAVEMVEMEQGGDPRTFTLLAGADFVTVGIP